MPRTTTSSRNDNLRAVRRCCRRKIAMERKRRNGQYRFLQKGQHLHNCANWIHLYNNFSSTRTFMQRKIILWNCAKKDYPNDIILMKAGAFIEVLNEDADIFHTHCGSAYMKGGIALTAFPFSRLNDYVTKLDEKGYTWQVVEDGGGEIPNRATVN